MTPAAQGGASHDWPLGGLPRTQGPPVRPGHGPQDPPPQHPPTSPQEQLAALLRSQGAVLDARSCRESPPSLSFHTAALPPGTVAPGRDGAAAPGPHPGTPETPGLLDLLAALEPLEALAAGRRAHTTPRPGAPASVSAGVPTGVPTGLSASEPTSLSTGVPTSVSAWVRQGRGMIGLGRSLTITASGQDRIEDLRAAWRAVVAASWWRDALVRPGTGPLALGTITFSSGSSYQSVLLVPALLVGVDEEGGWVTAAVPIHEARPGPGKGDGQAPGRTRTAPGGTAEDTAGSTPGSTAGTTAEDAAGRAVRLLVRLSRAATGSTAGSRPPSGRAACAPGGGAEQAGPPGHPLTVRSGALSEQAWCQAVGAAQAAMRSGLAHKVVLARDVLAQPGRQVPTSALVGRLAAAYPSTWTFAVDQMVGATPELLVRLRERRLTSRVLAGTARRGASHGEATRHGEAVSTTEHGEGGTSTGHTGHTAALASWLRSSGKNNREHRLALESALDALEPLCSAVTTRSPSPFVLELPNVLHLASDITGVVAGDTGALALVGALHPTAAVCGTPTSRAAHLIDQLEEMDRGRYAGPVGWVDWHGEGEWCIALRCAQLPATATSGGPPDDGLIRVFGGGGIMPDSRPADELAETSAKMRPVLDALEALAGQPTVP